MGDKKNAHWVSGRCHQGASTPFNIAVRGDTPQVDLQIFTINPKLFANAGFAGPPQDTGEVRGSSMSRINGPRGQKVKGARESQLLIHTNG